MLIDDTSTFAVRLNVKPCEILRRERGIRLRKERKSRKTKNEEKPEILLEQVFRGVHSYRVRGGRLMHSSSWRRRGRRAGKSEESDCKALRFPVCLVFGTINRLAFLRSLLLKY
jgi:hypothetical protein